MAGSDQRKQCEPVGLEFFDEAPSVVRVTETVRATPDLIFDVFQDASAWAAFAFPITGVEWTSPFPLSVGSTRTVFMRGGMTGWEEFIAWEPGTRMAFRFNETIEGGPDAFAEDWQVRDQGDGTCEVTWTMAMSLSGVSAKLMPVSTKLMGPGNAAMLKSFRRYVESNPRITVGHP